MEEVWGGVFQQASLISVTIPGGDAAYFTVHGLALNLSDAYIFLWNEGVSKKQQQNRVEREKEGQGNDTRNMASGTLELRYNSCIL